MSTEVSTDTIVVPDWAAGYAMEVPCIWEGCDREVAWWGNQHGCREGPCCDFHLRCFLEDLMGDMATNDHIRCRGCGGKFHFIGHFFTARPI